MINKCNPIEFLNTFKQNTPMSKMYFLFKMCEIQEGYEKKQ